MEWQKHRLMIGLAALLVLGGAAIWAVRTRTGDSPVSTTGAGAIEGFPEEISRDDITAIEITRPDEETVRLEHGEGGWRVSAPVSSRADQTSVDSALDKLAELSLDSVAARSATHHEQLEVDAAHGIHVVARHDDEVLADLWIGATRSGNTAVRVEGQDAVGMASGSIRFAFSRDLKDWRDRTILDLEADQVRDVAWVGPNGSFHFQRPMVAPSAPPPDVDAGAEAAEPVPGDWTMVDVSYVPTPEATDADAGVPAAPPGPSTTLDNFQSSKVRTMVSTLARLRAADFAAATVTRETAGISDASARVTLTMADGQVSVLRLGNAVPEATDQFYAVHEGDDTVFVVSRYHSVRISPTSAEFVGSAAPPPSEPEGGAPQFDLGGAGGPGGQIPPELLQQIQQQLQQQGGHP
ncbi:MAG: DUF4340 domain-containing protein [Sandaracinaceae bacterium]|nr:DUF4340 domain-containing protein [Sandaracinaceae bacterium]